MKKKLFFMTILLISISITTGCNSNNVFNNPDVKVVKEKIETLNDISDICIVTEDHDPNGKLNKQGGYTGALFFVNKNIDTTYYQEHWDDKEMKTVKSNDACDMGTVAGGSIEIYANESDAKKRNLYLEQMDAIISGGYHEIKGTLVIRISNDLTASEQKDFVDKIIKAIEK